MKSKRPPPALAPRPAISELAGNQAASIFSNSSISSSGNTIITDHRDSHVMPPPGHHNNYPVTPLSLCPLNPYPCTPCASGVQTSSGLSPPHTTLQASMTVPQDASSPSCPSTDPQSVLPPTPLSQCHSHLGVAWSPFGMLSTKVGMILRVPLACHAAPPWHFSLCWNASNDRKPTTLAIHPFVRKSCSIKSYPN